MTTKTTNTKEPERLSFYTTGEYFTNLIRDFLKEGSFHSAYEILIDGGLTDKTELQNFFLFKSKFEGDTRLDSSLDIVPCNAISEKDISSFVYYGLKSALEITGDDFDGLSSLYRYLLDEEDDSYRKLQETKNIYAFFKVFTIDELRDLIGLDILTQQGYEVNPDLTDVEPNDFSGVILASGDIVRCHHQAHHDLYPLLSALNFASCADWADDTQVIHITCGQLSGNVAATLRHYDLYKEREILITEQQIQKCFDIRNSLYGIYSRNSRIPRVLLRYMNQSIDFGGKFNNLSFLDKFYDFNLPKFSKRKFKGACIRTSPKYSMAGVLNSKFNVTDYDKAIKEIEADFEKHKALVGVYTSTGGKQVVGNELHYFFQEFLEGKNGVCLYWNHTKEFTYSVSSTQGDVVKGKASDEELTYKEGKALEVIARTLSNDFEESIQIEFVIHNDKVYIVQLRLLENNPRDFDNDYADKDILCKGKSFSAGKETVNIKDVLIVDSDCDSTELIGKKALIVREDVEFSHVLALSKALNIPSIYAVGNIKFANKITIDTQYTEGIILKK